MTLLVPYGYTDNIPGIDADEWLWLTVAELDKRTAWNRLHPEVRRRHLAIFEDAQRDGTVLGIGGGYRTSEQQLATFLSRYTTTFIAGADSIVWYEGKWWYLLPGKSPSTPPYRSYHEKTTAAGWALAVDTIGDWAYLAAHCAAYGLRQFKDVNNEPWHTQPVEIPTARRNYIEATHQLATWTLPARTPEPTTEPTTEDIDMAGIAAIYIPNAAVTAAAGGPNAAKWFALRADGGIRHACGSDVAAAGVLKAPSFPIEGMEHYALLDAASQK